MATFSFHHIHLRSPDPEATAAWLVEMLEGSDVVRSNAPWVPAITMKLGGQDLFINKVEPGSGVNPPPVTPCQGLDHFGLRVRGIDAIVGRLKASGVAFTMEPTTTRPGCRIAFLRGPQGISIELVDLDVDH